MNSKNNCHKTTNNKYFQCPPRMSDGRHFTDYRSNVYVNDLIRSTNNTGSNYEYRQFLIHNANSLMKMNNEYMDYMNGCSECNATQVPFKTECFINQNYSNCYLKDENGVGIYNKTSQIQDNKANIQLGQISSESFGTPKVTDVRPFNPDAERYSQLSS